MVYGSAQNVDREGWVEISELLRTRTFFIDGLLSPIQDLPRRSVSAVDLREGGRLQTRLIPLHLVRLLLRALGLVRYDEDILGGFFTQARGRNRVHNLRKL